MPESLQQNITEHNQLSTEDLRLETIDVLFSQQLWADNGTLSIVAL